MTTAVGILAAAITSAVPAAAESGISNGATYTVATTVIDGSTPENNGTWKAEIGQLSGGDPAVIKAFNDASQASARDQVPDVGVGDELFPWTFESRGRVPFRSIAIGQVITGNSYFGVSPTVFHSTVVIDSRNARPIMLTDLFTDEQAGLNRLSEQTKILLPEGQGSDQPGNAPIAKNFANWLPAADGLEIYFEAYQFGIRMAQTITVPWSTLTDVLAPDMAGLTR